MGQLSLENSRGAPAMVWLLWVVIAAFLIGCHIAFKGSVQA